MQAAMTTLGPGQRPGHGEPDILTVGPDQADRLSRRSVVVLLAAVMALIAGFVLWRFQPAPEPAFTLSDLQGVYAGMVRADGTNDAAVIDPDRSSEEAGHIVPDTCEPLFEATVLNRVPDEALDGVGTFWAIDQSAVSLFTYRFPDTASADREYTRLTETFDHCRGVHVEVRARSSGTGLLSGLPQDPAGEVPAPLGYVLTTGDGTKLAIHVLAFSNTVSWQFRYEPVLGAYSPLTANRMMDSLADRMRFVQDLSRQG
jgi:hypothetical protein